MLGAWLMSIPGAVRGRVPDYSRFEVLTGSVVLLVGVLVALVMAGRHSGDGGRSAGRWFHRPGR